MHVLIVVGHQSSTKVGLKLLINKMAEKYGDNKIYFLCDKVAGLKQVLFG